MMLNSGLAAITCFLMTSMVLVHVVWLMMDMSKVSLHYLCCAAVMTIVYICLIGGSGRSTHAVLLSVVYRVGFTNSLILTNFPLPLSNLMGYRLAYMCKVMVDIWV